MNDKIVTGPIQVFVIGFDRFEASGQILAELRRVRKRGVIRLVDLLFVKKDGQGKENTYISKKGDKLIIKCICDCQIIRET